MTINLLRNNSPEFRKALDAVQRELITIEHNAAGDFIKTPLNYPSGSAVVVQIGQIENRYFVSDFGMGGDEAEQWGISRASFARFAHAIADSTGTRFDNHAFFVMEAEAYQLPPAIITVANASQAAVTHAAMRSADKTNQIDNILFRRLELIFKGKAIVTNHAKIKGFSSTAWQVDALVNAQGEQSIFEVVRNHPNSIASTNMKFGDIGKLQNSPRRFAVVKNKKELGTYLNVLSQTANVIEDTLTDDKIAELTLAA